MTELDPAQQYKTPSNLTRRADFNARYGTVNWFDWVAEQAGAPGGRVLDIGCGPAWFWKKLAGRWQPDHLVLSDISEGMLEAAAERLGADYELSTVQADAVELPFEAETFDHVFAMHMLYHVTDPAKALAEMARVLKPGGRALITTIGDDDLKAIGDLSREAFGSCGTDLIVPVFGGARAKDLIPDAFAQVDHRQLRDTYCVDDTDAAVAYITSFPPGIDAAPEAAAAFRARFDAERMAAGGALRAERVQDLFIAQT